MRKKKPIEDIPSPGEKELLERIKAIPNKEIRSYAAFMYLMGNRVSEAIGGWQKEKIGTYTYTHPITKRVTKQPIYKTIYEKAYEPIKAWQFELLDGWLTVRNMPTLKRRDRKHFYRDVYVYLFGHNEKEFADIVMEWVNSMPPQNAVWPLRKKNKALGIKSFNRKLVWSAINDYVGIPPHKLRGMRATKDAVMYGMDALDLKRKYNWASADMAFHYAQKNPKDIKNKIMAASPNHHSA